MMQFPATNFHDLNLDWMLQQIKTMLAEWTQMQTDFTTIQGNVDTIESEWESEKTWMHNYVQTNLPVEVQALFDAFIETSTFQQMVANGISDTLVTTTITTWLENNIAQDPGYVLDTSLTKPLEAAQAKSAGDYIRDISVQYFPTNLAHGVGYTMNGNKHQACNASDGGLTNSTAFDATDAIALNGATRVTVLFIITTFTTTPTQGVSFYRTDDNPRVTNTFIGGYRYGNKAPSAYYVLRTFDVPTYTDDNDQTQYAPYIRINTLLNKYAIPLVYNADEFEAKLPGIVEALQTQNAGFVENFSTLNDFYNAGNFPYTNDLPLSVCHRGLADASYPENTIVSFKNAIDAGFQALETDLRFTSDGVAVLLHDASINRTARNADGSSISGTVNIADITYQQALQYDFGIVKGSQFAGTKIPTLDEFLCLCKMNHVYPVIELKESGTISTLMQSALDIMDKYDMSWRCMWICGSTGATSGTGLSYIAATPKYKHVCLGLTTSGGQNGWQYTDLETATGQIEARALKTGKNKVAFIYLYTSIVTDGTHTTEEMRKNFVDYCHKFGYLASTYCPTTEAGLAGLGSEFDVVISQYLKYNEVISDAVPNTLPTP